MLEPWNLLLIHGACEHGGRYLSFAEKARQAGFRVLIPDLRGHGHSTGNVVHIDRFEQYLEDQEAWLNELQFPPDKTFILGSSMGGLISIRLNQWRAKIAEERICQALFLVCPLLGLKHPVAQWKKLAARLLNWFWPETRFRSTIDPTDLTHNQKVLEARKLDTLQRHEVTARWFLEVNRAIELAFSEQDLLWPETWLYQSGDDRVVDPISAITFAEELNEARGKEQVNVRIFPGWFHELLREIDGDKAENLIIRQMVSVRDS